jgi:hypothetical protein
MKLRVALYCVLGGLSMLLPAMATGHVLWWYLSGLVLTAAFVPVAMFGPRSIVGQLGVILSVLFIVTVLTTWSEALLFVKVPAIQDHPFRNLAGEMFAYLVVGVALALLARALNINRQNGKLVVRHGVATAAAMLMVCGLAYMVYYLVFGAITYQYFTKPYYPHAADLVAPLGIWFWAIQIGRGFLMTLAVLPAIYTLRLTRGKVAISAGLLIWVAGGLAPLLVPNELMGSTQRFIHIVEIFTQNFTLGVTAGLLLRPKHGAETNSKPMAVAA